MMIFGTGIILFCLLLVFGMCRVSSIADERMEINMREMMQAEQGKPLPEKEDADAG